MGRRPENLTGLRAGKLVAIWREPSGRWICRCDCGRTRTLSAAALKQARKRGWSSSCGCTARIDLAGQKFGHLTAVSKAPECRWTCRCDCGATKVVTTNQLTRTRKLNWSISCGCQPPRPRPKGDRPAQPRKDLRQRRSDTYRDRRRQWLRACSALSRVFGAPPAEVAEAVRMAKRLHAQGSAAGASLRFALTKTLVDRDALIHAILQMPGANYRVEYTRVA